MRPPAAGAHAERNAKLLRLTSSTQQPLSDDGKVWQTITRETRLAGLDPTIPRCLAEEGHVAHQGVTSKRAFTLVERALVDISYSARLDRAKLPVVQATKSSNAHNRDLSKGRRLQLVFPTFCCFPPPVAQHDVTL